MIYKAQVAVCSEIRTKHSTQNETNVEFFNVTRDGYSDWLQAGRSGDRIPASDGVGGQRHVPADLPPGKTRYPLYRRLGGHQDRSAGVREISAPNWFRSSDRPVWGSNLGGDEKFVLFFELTISLSSFFFHSYFPYSLSVFYLPHL